LSLTPVANLIGPVLGEAGILPRFLEYSLVRHWEEIVGAAAAANSRPLFIRRQTLTVAVSSGPWHHYLFTVKQSIIEKINLWAGKPLVKDLRLKERHLEPLNQYLDQKFEPPAALDPVSPADEDWAAAAGIVGSIPEGPLKTQAIRAIALSRWRRRQLKKAGWKPCHMPKCTALCPPDATYCPSCRALSNHREQAALLRILLNAPWLGYNEVNRLFPCSARRYRTVRALLLHRLRAEAAGPESAEARVARFSLAILAGGLKSGDFAFPPGLP